MLSVPLSQPPAKPCAAASFWSICARVRFVLHTFNSSILQRGNYPVLPIPALTRGLDHGRAREHRRASSRREARSAVEWHCFRCTLTNSARTVRSRLALLILLPGKMISIYFVLANYTATRQRGLLALLEVSKSASLRRQHPNPTPFSGVLLD